MLLTMVGLILAVVSPVVAVIDIFNVLKQKRVDNFQIVNGYYEENVKEIKSLNYYEITALNNMLSQLSRTELSEKKKQAESILNDEKSTLKKKIISEHIICYCEMFNGKDS